MLSKAEPAEYSIKTRNDTDITLTGKYQARNSCLDLIYKGKGLRAGNRNRWVTGRHNIDRAACQAKSIRLT